MKTVFSVVNSWLPQRTAVALATVVETWGSSPRQAGAKMAFTADGKIVGSVSGGCVEGAVIEAGQETLQTGRPQLLHFGVADKTAWDVGLACGGTIEVFVQRLDTAVFSLLSQLINENRAGTVFTVIRGPGLGKSIVIAEDGRVAGTLGADLDERAHAVPSIKQSQRLALTDSIEVFADAIRPAPTLVMVGGVHIAVALTSLAKTVGYRTVVVDPRRAFGDNERFPHADKLIAAWPDKAFEQIELNSGTAVALLTHDPKIDDPALKIVLNSPVFYIGALGSRHTHAQRRQRLQKMGFDDETINRIHGPIGLNIGARSPEEIALSIMAEIVNVRRLPLE
ncbi:MAG: XdhC/CoxI family protein [Chloroflexi bacterium]|nr:XdhC/CoxI family protein [Chloroflexota bacterium]